MDVIAVVVWHCGCVKSHTTPGNRSGPDEVVQDECAGGDARGETETRGQENEVSRKRILTP